MRRTPGQSFDKAVLFTLAAQTHGFVSTTRQVPGRALAFKRLDKGGHGIKLDGSVVDIEHAALHLDLIAGHTHNTLDEIRAVHGMAEDDNISALRL